MPAEGGPMFSAPRRLEIDHRTIKLIVGLVALSMAWLTNRFATAPLTSISAAYWEDTHSRTVFVGFLFAIGAFLLAYNGRSRTQMIAGKVAALAGLCVAWFPCECDCHDVRIRYVHFPAAAAMFLILAFFCYDFYRRARGKGHAQATVRAFFYAASGVAILASIAVLATDALLGHPLLRQVPRLVFYGERTGLVAFGFSWLIASRALPIVTRPDERFVPFRDINPD
jgi:hypothetical protein